MKCIEILPTYYINGIIFSAISSPYHSAALWPSRTFPLRPKDLAPLVPEDGYQAIKPSYCWEVDIC